MVFQVTLSFQTAGTSGVLLRLPECAMTVAGPEFKIGDRAGVREAVGGVHCCHGGEIRAGFVL
ncbi:hypothetical protein LBMAG46_02220 [Planctomycetia bacterium]|jgi:hypothetical protein|nr:hypothetical protein LBMAG46_02220 [Planctomycetia bacterium]